MGVGSPDILAKLVNFAVIGFAVVAALNQLGVATVVVNTLLISPMSAVAFGLGGVTWLARSRGSGTRADRIWRRQCGRA